MNAMLCSGARALCWQEWLAGGGYGALWRRLSGFGREMRFCGIATAAGVWLREQQRSAYSGFFSAEQRFPTERNESVTEVKRMERLAGAVERFVCGSGSQIEGSKCRAVLGPAFAGDRAGRDVRDGECRAVRSSVS